MDNRTSIESLIIDLYNSDDSVKQQAAEKLVEIGESTIPYLLPELRKKDRNESMSMWEDRTIQRILIRLGDPALKILSEALNSNSQNNHMGRAAVKALVGFSKDERIIEPLLNCMSDKNSRGRLYAIDALGFLKNERSFEPLLSLLQDDDILVVAHAARALGEFRDQKAIKPLRETLNRTETSPWMDWRKTVTEALKTISDPSYTPLDRGFFINERYY